jgi:succinate-semialdehyde dehydrogenase/glutarate-semialdehyde dehydrogenase
VSPSTGEQFATVAVADLADVDAAVRAGASAFGEWSALSAFDRAAACERIAVGIGARREELARALTEDQGKPLVAEAYDEVDELAVYFTMAGEDAKRMAGALPSSTSADRRVLTARVPLGGIGVVSPWNWPYTMGAEIFSPAIAA